MRFTYRNWVELSTPRTRARTYGPALVLCGLQLSLPVLAWIHALALQPKAEGHTGLYSFVRHRTTCRKTTNIWTATLELTVWSYWTPASTFLLFELRTYVLRTDWTKLLSGTEVIIIQLQNKEIIKCHQRFFCDWNDCPMKVRTIVLFFDLLQFLWKCCLKIIFNSIYILLH